MNPPNIITLVEARDPVLRTVCPLVNLDNQEEFDYAVDTAYRMLEYVQRNPAAGLAAPQIGVPLSMFVMQPDRSKHGYIVINPKILHYGHRREEQIEGCLSLPQIRLIITRPLKVIVEYHDQNKKRHKKAFEGFTSRVFQHEFDHVQSVLMIDRAVPDSSMIQLVREKFGIEPIQAPPNESK